MIWDSWSDFFAMGGYGLYVWGSLVAVFIFIIIELVALAWRRQALLEQHQLTRIPARQPAKGRA